MKIRALLVALTLSLALVAGSARAAAADTTVYKVWFERGGKLWLVKREQPVTSTPARSAVQALLAGPDLAEADAGVHSHVPAGTALLGLSVAAGTATVDLSSGFAAAEDAAGLRMRLAQLTYTLAQFPTIDRVVLEVNGRPVTSLAGAAVPQPMTQTTYRSLVPAITVWNPAIGSHLSGGVRVTGMADVFESHLDIRIVNDAGATIAHAAATATCGTGCRGGYTVLVPFTVARDQLGTIVVSDEDADGNGVPQHRVRIPVVLLA
jgi:hypothetical protein